MSVLFWHSFKTAMFTRILEVAIATSNLMDEVYKGGFPPGFNVSMLKEINPLVWEYLFKTR